MAVGRIKWDQTNEKLYETGVEQGVLYLLEADGAYDTTVAGWNGLINVTESPSGAEATALWADDMKYLNLTSAEEFGATIEAYTYPEEFAECDGSKEATEANGVYIGQQGRAKFGFCYKTLIGNDGQGDDYGYKLHLVYGCQATPSEKAYGTKNDSPEAITFSWTISTTPESFKKTEYSAYKPTSVIVIDSTKFTGTAATKLKDLEDKLYGVDADTEHSITGSEPYLPLPDEVLDTLKVE